ncbi:MAG: TolC family protein, partial [Nitrospira sp.]|nr:TolC family protein [Nitrospira sp.]
DTVSTVALKYYEGLRQEETLRARLANLKLYEELVDFIRARYAGGMVTGLDVARLESELEHERQRVALTKGDVERAKLDLLNTLGIGESLQVVLNDSLSTFEGSFPDNQQAFELAIRNRPELQMQQQRIKSAELSVKSIKGERLPALSLQGDWGMIGNQSNNTLSTYSVGAVLSVPLWDGGQREGRIGEASSQLTQEQIRLQLVKNQVSLELREALVTLKAALEQYRVAKDGLKASLTQVSLAQQRIRTLSSTTLELSNALSALARARDNMVDALFRVNASRVNLARATGEAKALR